MKTIKYRYIDKSNWPHGPWDDEPDKIQWPDPVTGLPCLAVRSSMGNWCGYVGVPEGHPYFMKEYGDVDVACHGGLTFSGSCAEDGSDHGICHVVEPGESDRVWWLGFDCGHAFDLMPGMRLMEGSVYRNLTYVQDQCFLIAAQLKAACLRSS